MSESSSGAVPSSDAELIAAVASGDAASYVTLQVRHTSAVRILARQLVASPDEAEEVLAETFDRLRDVLRRGDGPVESLRPYLLTAVRRVALERRSEALGGLGVLGLHTEHTELSEPAAEEAEIPNLGEPLFTDPAVAELESTTLARAYASLPERLRAAAWHIMIERTEPAQAATILGLTEAGVAELPAQVSAALSQAYLELYLTSLTQEACKAEAGQLGQHLNSATRGLDERTVRVHLRVCRECRGVAVELTGLDRSLRRTMAPIFLGPAAAAYLSAVAAKAAPAGQAVDGLRWVREAQRWMQEAPRRMRQASRQQQALAGGVLVLAAFAIAGLSLTLAANTVPQHRADRPLAAAIAPPSPAITVPSSSPAPAPTRSAHTKPAPTAAPTHPAPTRSSSPAPASPAPTTPAPTSPAPTPTPTPHPSPTPSPHHHHHHLPPVT
jgi:DNA-directed RNA polymerase specialized sigma24 family protein